MVFGEVEATAIAEANLRGSLDLIVAAIKFGRDEHSSTWCGWVKLRT